MWQVCVDVASGFFTTNQALVALGPAILWQPFSEGRVKDAMEMTARNRDRIGLWGSEAECGVRLGSNKTLRPYNFKIRRDLPYV